VPERAFTISRPYAEYFSVHCAQGRRRTFSYSYSMIPRHCTEHVSSLVAHVLHYPPLPLLTHTRSLLTHARSLLTLRPRLVVSRSTCPPLSPSPNSFVIGTVVINNNCAQCTEYGVCVCVCVHTYIHNIHVCVCVCVCCLPLHPLEFVMKYLAKVLKSQRPGIFNI
jgi:hypothetical protein